MVILENRGCTRHNCLALLQKLPTMDDRLSNEHHFCRSKAATGPPNDQLVRWLKDFQTKVVDVNRTSRGSPTGGVGRFSAIVACGNAKVRASLCGKFDHYKDELKQNAERMSLAMSFGTGGTGYAGVWQGHSTILLLLHFLESCGRLWDLDKFPATRFVALATLSIVPEFSTVHNQDATALAS